jgi:ribose transport system substrate-binding protein
MAKHCLSRRDFLRAGLMTGAGVAASTFMSLVEYRQAVGQSQPIHAAMSSAGLAGTWNAQGKAAAENMCKLLNVTLEWFDGEFDPVKQRAKFDDIATKKWDFVAVQPNSIGALKEPIQALAQANIPVIDMDTLIVPLADLKDTGVLTFIAPDNVFMSEAVVTKLFDSIGGKGKVAHTWGQQGHTGAQGRAQGFYNVVKRYPNIEVVDDEFGDWDVAKAANIWQTILNKYPDLAGGFLHNDDMALSARKVVEDAGLADQIKIVGIDAMPPAIQAVADGKLIATARNSANRIHSWAVVAGVYAATVGLEAARAGIPQFILADGPAIFGDIDSNPDVTDPWKLKNYGLSSIPGQLWEEDQFLF